MIMFTDSLRFEWKQIGRCTRIAHDSPNDCISLTVGSGHLQIRSDVFAPSAIWALRPIVFTERGRRSVDTILCFDDLTFATAFDLPRPESRSNKFFAHENHAEYGIPEKFVRWGDRLNLLCENMRGEEEKISFFLSSLVKANIAKFREYYLKRR
jgi:hypothetical protein